MFSAFCYLKTSFGALPMKAVSDWWSVTGYRVLAISTARDRQPMVLKSFEPIWVAPAGARWRG
jgi:hypothetical protein